MSASIERNALSCRVISFLLLSILEEVRFISSCFSLFFFRYSVIDDCAIAVVAAVAKEKINNMVVSHCFILCKVD